MSPQRSLSGLKSTVSAGSIVYVVVKQEPHGSSTATKYDKLYAAVVQQRAVWKDMRKLQFRMWVNHQHRSA